MITRPNKLEGLYLANSLPAYWISWLKVNSSYPFTPHTLSIVSSNINGSDILTYSLLPLHACCGWKTTLLTSLFFVRTSIFLALSPHGTTLTVLKQMSVYGCSQMLDVLVSSHPITCRLNDIQPNDSVYFHPWSAPRK